MPDEIYCKRLDESSLKGVIYLGVGGTEYIRADIHDRRVTELLEANNKLVEENRKLRNEAQEKWQTIDSAPRDGTEIIICSPLNWANDAREIDDPNVGAGNYIGAFRFVKGVWKNRLSHWLNEDRPTHWMPLPEPPK